ncbi:MAG: lipocalin-like domain-containing protein [Burkholderiales bacterium]
MRRRRFLATAASAASAVAVAPLASLVGCGDASNGEPLPVPPSDVVLRLPQDMYLHEGAPTEWWWHIGTLRAGERVFGFEINAASFEGQGFAFTQVMLSDVARDRHYQRTTPFVPLVFEPRRWAESDPAKDWYARLGSVESRLSALELVSPGSGYTSDPQIEIVGGGGSGAAALAVRDAATGGLATVVLVSAGSGYTSLPEVRVVGGGGSGAVVRALHTYVSMTAPQSDPTQDMHVQALLIDDPSLTEVRFDLRFSQQGRPFFVWGTGINPGGSGHDLQTNNYYFSLTRLAASGTIEVGGEVFQVEGTTWMDHEYGAFGTAANPVKWFLQDMQLDDGTCISNYSTIEEGLPALGERRPSNATIQDASGSIWYVPTFVTPIGRTWTSPVSGETYFMKFRIEIPSFDAELVVESLMDSQEFPVVGSPVYEGAASAEGTFRGRRVRGTAWNEQDL